jgi:hypothetical protein
MRPRFHSDTRSGLWIALASIVLISTFGSMTAVRAATCDDQKGKVIFEDTFADDSGGWQTDPNTKIGGGAFAYHLNSPTEDHAELNVSFNASDADYCMEVVVPKSAAANNTASVGLIFWATDASNLFEANITSDGRAQLWKMIANKWIKMSEMNDPSLKLDVDSVAVIRVRESRTLIAASVNGVDFKNFRVQIPRGDLMFGIDIGTIDGNPAPGIDITVKRFRVTDGK